MPRISNLFSCRSRSSVNKETDKMNSKVSWPTRLNDIVIAEEIMSQFINDETIGLNLFELVVDIKEKSMNFALSPWVTALASKYNKLYGEDEGEVVTRRVISLYMRQTQTLH
jgi:hypothetical protein